MENITEEISSKPEQKLRAALDSMRQILSSDTTPIFKDFWEAKRVCLELFKEKLPPHVRTLYWNEYIELSDAIRQIKALLDEKSSFAEEQIDLAVKAVEKDLENFEARLGEMMGSVELPVESKGVLQNGSKYVRLQKELDLLNTFAGRLNGLRKELTQTQMRIRNKNKLFQKLSALGDSVFPKRKEQIKALSDLLVADVEKFSAQFDLSKGPYFGLKDEIRALQKFAKTLSVSPTAFNRTRESLSGCWDQIKDKEALAREQRSEEKERFKQQFEDFSPKIEAFKGECAELKLSSDTAGAKIEELIGQMKELGFGNEEIKGIRKQLFEAKKIVEEKESEDRRRAAEAEVFEKQSQAKAYQTLLQITEEVLDQADILPLNVLVEKWEAFLKEEKALKIAGIEKAVIENRLGSIADSIQEKKWKSSLEGSPEELVSSLNVLLNERQKEKRKLKEALEAHRKIVGGSSLGFEQSLQYQELIREEKMRLDTIETMVEEIEEKLFDLEE